MNVYDFDKTIFYPDCTYAFMRWCLHRYPKLLVTYLPGLMFYSALYASKKVKRYHVEEKLLSFITAIEDIEQEVENFWRVHENRISPWYLEQKRPDDLIISASPEFLLRPLAQRLNVRLIATQMDMKTAKINGYSCYGRQKVMRALDNEYIPEEAIDCFYSDSLSDAPMALCAEQAFLVVDKARRPVPWPELSPKIKKKVMKKLAEDMSKTR